MKIPSTLLLVLAALVLPPAGTAQSSAGAQPALDPIDGSERQSFLVGREAVCTAEVRRGDALLMLVADGSLALAKPGGVRWELSQLGRNAESGRFVIQFEDPTVRPRARREIRLTAEPLGQACAPAHCTRYRGKLELADLNGNFSTVIEGLTVDEVCANRQLNRLFYKPSLIERIMRAMTG